MAQYGYLTDTALEGQIADLGPRYVRSLRNDSDADQPFGIAVTLGADDNSFGEIGSDTDEVVGIIAHTHAFDVNALTGTNGVPDEGVANVVSMGVVNVRVEEAVTPASDVYVRYANGVADPLEVTKGSFRASADTSTARKLHGARYLTSADAGGVAQVWFVAPVSSFDVDLAALQADIDAVEALIHTPAANEAAIKAIAAADRSNGMVVVDLTNDVLWTFDSGSSATASAWVLVPDAGTGRWLRNNASLADLAGTTATTGANLLGLEDSDELLTAATVEDGIAELAKYQCIDLADPGTGEAIPVTRSATLGLVILDAVETNTLAVPTFVGQTLRIYAKSLAGSGSRAITVAAAINVADNTILTFDAVSEFASLVAVQVGAGLVWQVDGIDGATPSGP